MTPSPTILVTGAGGQLGSVLVPELRSRYGRERVVATDLRQLPSLNGPFELLDATDEAGLTAIVKKYQITQIYHLAAILSATGEANPIRTFQINTGAFLNVLETARREKVERIFYPSTIAVFGKSAPLVMTPNDAYLDPLTAYGISKVAGENWSLYFWEKYGLDVRSIRFPGVIGHQSNPGGGTTDYAVDIFHHAVQSKEFSCFLEADETLPMIYIDDAIRATIELMEAPVDKIKNRASYNLAGVSFSPAEVVAAIKLKHPGFVTNYAPDFRQAIAAGWPDSIDDRPAREDWGWQPEYDLDRLVDAMLEALNLKYQLHVPKNDAAGQSA